jgi:hypothetical protein
MKAYGGIDIYIHIYIHIFLTSALVGGEWSASRSCHFTPGGRTPDVHSIGVWVGTRAGLNHMEKRKFLPLPGLALWPLLRPARSQSLFRLYYTGSCIFHRKNKLRGFSPQSELYRPSDRHLSAKWVPTLAGGGCRVVSATNPHDR